MGADGWSKRLFFHTEPKGRVSIRGFSWYLNVSIIFWEQVLCALCTKSGRGIYTTVLLEVIN